MHILLVEADASTAIVFERQLQSLGHIVTRTPRAFEAIDLLRTGVFGMMITGTALSDMDTVDLVRISRKLSMKQYLFIMLLCDRHDQKLINQCLDAGADDYMVRPIDPIELSLRARNAQRIVSIDTRDDAIIAMAKLAESRDASTGRHVERVRQYSRELAQAAWEMGHYLGSVDATFVDLIYRTAALHDLGKVAIPDTILLKPGKLTSLEFDLMKTHTSLGAEALAEVVNDRSDCNFLRMGREIALSHHERWDGKGYPRGLVGEQIPIAARIVSIADVYDALTSVRSYKQAFTHHEALQYIIDGAGTQFDPLLVESFAAIERQIDRIRAREADPVEPETTLDIRAA